MVSHTFYKGVALTLSILLACSLTADALECYKCKTTDPNHACLTNPSAGGVTTCIGGVSHCITRSTYNTVSNNMSEFERDCEIKVPVIGDKTECKTTGSSRMCQVVCGKDLCNKIVQSEVESCVTTPCSAAGAIFTAPILMLAALAQKMLF